jgi:hypothetical protein
MTKLIDEARENDGFNLDTSTLVRWRAAISGVNGDIKGGGKMPEANSEADPVDLDSLGGIQLRITNRSNRLERLKELEAPQEIIDNEKKLLQQGIDMLWVFLLEGKKPSEQ